MSTFLKKATNKTKALSLSGHHTVPIYFKRQDIKSFRQFVYLGSIGSPDGVTYPYGSAKYLNTNIELGLFPTFFLCCYMGSVHEK